MRLLKLLVLLLAATAADAATFLIPPDRELVAASKAIVVATAGESYGRWGAGHWLETVTSMHVVEAIKGPVGDGATIDVVALGGTVGDLHYVVAGSPSYTPGERVLLFLETNGRGEWTAKNMVVGKFSARSDVRGRRLLVRDADDLTGWDEDGSPHRERMRLEREFLAFVRAEARGESGSEAYVVDDPAPLPVRAEDVAASAFSASSYGMRVAGRVGSLPMRWNSFPQAVVFLSHGTQPGAAGGGLTSLQRGLAAWSSVSGANIVYLYGGTTGVSQAFNNNDGVDTVQFNDPSNEIPGSFSPTGGATLAIGGAWAGSSTHVFAGEQFYTISEADLVVQDGISGSGVSGNGFDHVLTHELGHTLGIRHSDKDANENACAAPLDCSQNAIMRSTVAFNSDPFGSSLQAWDVAAAVALYGSGGVTPSCNAPKINAQPQTVEVGSTAVTFSVTASGDAPLRYQWYTGTAGNTSAPITGATSPTLSIKPAVTTAYWVRVSNDCDPPADSGTAYAIVNSCPPVVIASQSPDPAMFEGRPTTLSVSASGGTLSYQWFRGAVGVTSSPVSGANGASVTVSPSTTTTYWALVTNSCGSSAASAPFTVTVTPCAAPKVVVQPASANVVNGTSPTLYAGVTGSGTLTYQWYEGTFPDRSRPVSGGNGPTLTLPPLFAASSYWLHVESECGSADSSSAQLTIVPACVAPAIVVQPRNAAVTPGTTATLTVTATGATLSYQWYEGARLDFTRPRGGSAPSLVTGAINAPAQFWVRISSPCGSIDSDVVTVTPGTTRRRAAR